MARPGKASNGAAPFGLAKATLRHVGFVGIGLMLLLAGTGQARAQNLTQIENQERIQTEMQADTTGAATATGRRIPNGVVLGELTLDVFPNAWLNRQAVTLAPGFRLLDGLNRIVVPSTALGRSNTVAYLMAPGGQVLTAWIVTASERNEIRRRQ